MADQLARGFVEACPECVRGAHRLCPGKAIDHARDLRSPCPCRAAGHAGGPWPLPVSA